MTLERDTTEMRSVYSRTLLDMVEERPELVVMEADLMAAMHNRCIKEKHPGRMVNVGIAEANLMGVSAGLAAYGKQPVAHTFCAFITRRCYDQISVSVCYAGLPVKIVGSDPGVAAEFNGGTHMTFEDVGIMRTLATMTVFEPCDNVQMRQAVPAMLDRPGPVYMRMYRKTPYKVYSDGYRLTLGRADLLRQGTDLTIIASGVMVWNALMAAEELAGRGIAARVINMHTLKPLDDEAVVAAARETGAIVTAENHNIHTGLGGAVAEVLCESSACVPFKRIGIRDHYGEVGEMSYLMDKYGLAPRDIVAAAEAVVGMKKRGGTD